MTHEELLAKRDELSAKYQTDDTFFAGLDSEMHEAFCFGFDAGYAEGQAEIERLQNIVTNQCITFDQARELRAKLEKAKSSARELKAWAIEASMFAGPIRKIITELESDDE